MPKGVDKTNIVSSSRDKRIRERERETLICYCCFASVKWHNQVNVLILTEQFVSNKHDKLLGYRLGTPLRCLNDYEKNIKREREREGSDKHPN